MYFMHLHQSNHFVKRSPPTTMLKPPMVLRANSVNSSISLNNPSKASWTKLRRYSSERPRRPLFNSHDEVFNTLALDILRSFTVIKRCSRNSSASTHEDNSSTKKSSVENNTTNLCFRLLTQGGGPSYKLPAIWNLDEAGIENASVEDNNIREAIVPKFCRKDFDIFEGDTNDIDKSFDIPSWMTIEKRLKAFREQQKKQNTFVKISDNIGVINKTDNFILQDLMEARKFLKNQALLWSNSSFVTVADENLFIEVTTGYIGAISKNSQLWRHIKDKNEADGYNYEEGAKIEKLQSSVEELSNVIENSKDFGTTQNSKKSNSNATNSSKSSMPPHIPGSDPFVHAFCYNVRFFNCSTDKMYRVVGRDLSFFCKNANKSEKINPKSKNAARIHSQILSSIGSENNVLSAMGGNISALSDNEENFGKNSDILDAEFKKDENLSRHFTNDSDRKKALSDVDCEIWTKQKFIDQSKLTHKRFGTNDLNPHYSGIVKQFPLIKPGEEYVCGNGIVFDLTRSLRPNIFNIEERLGTMKNILESTSVELDEIEEHKDRTTVRKKNNKKLLSKRINDSNSKLHAAKEALIAAKLSDSKNPRWKDLSFHMSGGFHILEECVYTDKSKVDRPLTRHEKLGNMKFQQFNEFGDGLKDTRDFTIRDRAKAYENANLNSGIAHNSGERSKFLTSCQANQDCFFWAPISQRNWAGRDIVKKRSAFDNSSGESPSGKC